MCYDIPINNTKTTKKATRFLPVQSGCLFCEDEPCAIHADKPKKQRTRKPAGSAPSASIPSPIPTTSTPTSDDWVQTAPKKFEEKVSREELPEQIQDELELREAIRNLEPLLHRRAKAQYRDMLQPRKDARLSKLGAEVRRYLNGTVR